MINPAQLLGLQLPPGVQVRRQTYRVYKPVLPASLLPYEPNRIVAYVTAYNWGAKPVIGSRTACASGDGMAIYNFTYLPVFGSDELFAFDSTPGTLDITAIDFVAVPDAIR